MLLYSSGWLGGASCYYIVVDGWGTSCYYIVVDGWGG